MRFRLKPWADRFLLIRMDLYYEMFGDLEGEKDDSTDILGQWNPVPHRGFEDTACFDLWLATFHILEMLYDSPFPTVPQNDLPIKAERNAEIRTRHQQGETISQLAATFDISEQRVWQILRGQRN